MLTEQTDSAEQGGSLRAYGRRRGVSVEAVRRAIKSGRLKTSIAVDAKGKPKIVSFALADREWSANTDLSKAPGYVKERGPLPQAESQAVTATPSTRDTPVTRLPDGQASGDEPQSALGRASAEEKRWKAKLAELDYARRSGELVNAKDVEARLVDLFARCRTKLLGLPSKTKAALPHLSHADVLVIDGLVREALEDLADSPTTQSRGTAA